MLLSNFIDLGSVALLIWTNLSTCSRHSGKNLMFPLVFILLQQKSCNALEFWMSLENLLGISKHPYETDQRSKKTLWTTLIWIVKAKETGSASCIFCFPSLSFFVSEGYKPLVNTVVWKRYLLFNCSLSSEAISKSLSLDRLVLYNLLSGLGTLAVVGPLEHFAQNMNSLLALWAQWLGH